MISYFVEISIFTGVEGCGVISGLSDFCASFQHGVFRHMARRLMRAIQFLDQEGLIPAEKHRFLVFENKFPDLG